jgi:hypothetical protein
MDYTALRNAGVYVNTTKNRWFCVNLWKPVKLWVSKPFDEVESLKNKTPQYNNGVLYPRRIQFGFSRVVGAGGGAL